MLQNDDGHEKEKTYKNGSFVRVGIFIRRREMFNIMPANSSKQLGFMWLVHGLQKGKVSQRTVRPVILEAAKSMNTDDVKDYLMEECGLKECGVGAKKRILIALRELRTPLGLGEEQMDTPNPIASTKIFHGDFDNTLKMYRGFELTPKENQAIQNFDEAEPTAHDKFKVQYSKSDDYGNTSTFVVKKLREPNGQFVYTALLKSRAGEDQAEQPAEPPSEPSGQPPKPPSQAPTGAVPPQEPVREADGSAGDEIKLIKSVPINDQEGSEILTNFLQAVYRTKS
jgi:hypothetical protein